MQKSWIATTTDRAILRKREVQIQSLRWILATIDDNDIPKSVGVQPGSMGTGETVAVFAFHQDKVGFTAC